MAIIHHATAARALKLGCSIIEAGAAAIRAAGIKSEQVLFQLVRVADDALSAEVFESAKDAVQALADGKVTFGKLSKSKSGVMVISYHKVYTLNGGGNGDMLDVRLREILKGEEGIDLGRLRTIADDNGVWNDRWNGLNPGMQRMNLANRLRAILRNSPTATVNLDGEAGRFGVVFQPSKKAAKASAPKAPKVAKPAKEKAARKPRAKKG